MTDDLGLALAVFAVASFAAAVLYLCTRGPRRNRP